MQSVASRLWQQAQEMQSPMFSSLTSSMPFSSSLTSSMPFSSATLQAALSSALAKINENDYIGGIKRRLPAFPSTRICPSFPSLSLSSLDGLTLPRLPVGITNTLYREEESEGQRVVRDLLSKCVILSDYDKVSHPHGIYSSVYLSVYPLYLVPLFPPFFSTPAR